MVKANAGRILRHAAVDVSSNVLRIYYSRIGDRPERILVTEVRLTPKWSEWGASEPTTILEPERDYEGGTLPLEVSEPGDAPARVRELRDPAVYREGSRTYLVYSISGESGLAMAELVRQKSYAKGKAGRLVSAGFRVTDPRARIKFARLSILHPFVRRIFRATEIDRSTELVRHTGARHSEWDSPYAQA